MGQDGGDSGHAEMITICELYGDGRKALYRTLWD